MKRLAGILLVIVCTAAIHIDVGRLRSDRLARATTRLSDGVLRIVIVGDSMAYGAGDEKGLGIGENLALASAGMRAASIVNLGINGARTFTLQRLLGTSHAQSMIRAADAVIVSIGGNDLYGDSMARLASTLAPQLTRERVLTRVAGVVARIHGINPAARITLLGVYNPYRCAGVGAFLDEQVNLWDARLTWRFASDPYVTVIRVADLLNRPDRLSPIDHFHPGAIGYTLIAARIAPSL